MKIDGRKNFNSVTLANGDSLEAGKYHGMYTIKVINANRLVIAELASLVSKEQAQAIINDYLAAEAAQAEPSTKKDSTMSLANAFGQDCVKIIHEMNIKAAKNGYDGYKIRSIEHYAKLYNNMVKLGASDELIQLNLVNIATGEFI